jgi:hypothetical protein
MSSCVLHHIRMHTQTSTLLSFASEKIELIAKLLDFFYEVVKAISINTVQHQQLPFLNDIRHNIHLNTTVTYPSLEYNVWIWVIALWQFACRAHYNSHQLATGCDMHAERRQSVGMIHKLPQIDQRRRCSGSETNRDHCDYLVTVVSQHTTTMQSKCWL